MSNPLPETSLYSHTSGPYTIDITTGGDLRLLVGGEALRAPLPTEPAERFKMACAVAEASANGSTPKECADGDPHAAHFWHDLEGDPHHCPGVLETAEPGDEVPALAELDGRVYHTECEVTALRKRVAALEDRLCGTAGKVASEPAETLAERPRWRDRDGDTWEYRDGDRLTLIDRANGSKLGVGAAAPRNMVERSHGPLTRIADDDKAEATTEEARRA